MIRPSLAFEGLEDVETLIQRYADRIGYVTIQDRTVRGDEANIGRFNFDDSHAAPYLTGVSGWTRGSPIPPPLMAQACLTWLRDVAARNTRGDHWRKFRVKIQAPKAHDLLESVQFECRDLNATDDEPSASAAYVMPEMPTFEEAEVMGSMKGLQALGKYYADYGKIVLSTVSQIQGLYESSMTRMDRQLRGSQSQVDQLVSSMLDHRVEQVKAREIACQQQAEASQRSELAHTALNKLEATAAKFIMASQGMTPEMADIAAIVAQTPALQEALKKPEVAQLLRDPKALEQLTMLLRATSQS